MTPLREALAVGIGALKIAIDAGIMRERHVPARETLDRFHALLCENAVVAVRDNQFEVWKIVEEELSRK